MSGSGLHVVDRICDVVVDQFRAIERAMIGDLLAGRGDWDTDEIANRELAVRPILDVAFAELSEWDARLENGRSAAVKLAREFIGIENERRVLQRAWERLRAADGAP